MKIKTVKFFGTWILPCFTKIVPAKVTSYIVYPSRILYHFLSIHPFLCLSTYHRYEMNEWVETLCTFLNFTRCPINADGKDCVLKTKKTLWKPMLPYQSRCSHSLPSRVCGIEVSGDKVTVLCNTTIQREPEDY